MKTNILRSLLLSMAALLLPYRCFAADDDGSAALGCMACGTFGIVLIVAAIVLNIALLVWVNKDAKARNMDNSVIWMILVLFTGVLGLIIYIFSRPKGDLIVCGNCGNKRLSVSVKCPHCGA